MDMRHSLIAAALLLAACNGSDNNQVTADNAAAVENAGQQNVENELIETENGARVLRLEGNDSATFVNGNLVEVNRAR
jgi:hypothetical protein